MRGILKELISQGEGVTLADMEAGIEHLSRATVADVDVLLVVVEPYFKSIYTAEKVVALGRELGIPRVLAIANKIRGAQDAEAVTGACARWGVEVVAEVPFDEAVRDAEQQRRAPLDAAPRSPAMAAVETLAQRLAAAA